MKKNDKDIAGKEQKQTKNFDQNDSTTNKFKETIGDTLEPPTKGNILEIEHSKVEWKNIFRNPHM